jgi:hypothetical protein
MGPRGASAAVRGVFGFPKKAFAAECGAGNLLDALSVMKPLIAWCRLEKVSMIVDSLG